jgi:hypothetical protein
MWVKISSNRGDAELARYLESLAEKEPVIDLLVIDEAHYLRNPETQSATLGHLLREVSEHIVLLSATPINNKGGDLFQLLRLVDPDSFAVAEVFPQVLKANEPLLKARHLALDPDADGAAIQHHLHEAAQHPLLAGNRQLAGLLERELDADYLAEKAHRVDLANRIERINLLRHTVNRTRKVEVQELRVTRKPYSEFVTLDVAGPEWDFYQRVTDAIRRYALAQGINDGLLLAPPQRQIASCMYAAARSWLLDPQLITPFPEFVAQVAGYVRSPRRREGLHTLIDIGAGTLDVTTFNVFERDSEDYFPIFARGVEPLGTQFLIQHRLANAKNNGSWNPSSFEPVPSDAVFLKKLALNPQQLQELDQPFKNQVLSVFRSKVQLTRQQGNPDASHFATGVPTFLCGGGGKVAWYVDRFQPFEQASPPFKIVMTSIALPDTLQAPGIQKATYDRLSVAYGLSHNPDDLGEIALMGKDFDPIEPRPTRSSSYADRYVDKDMM